MPGAQLSALATVWIVAFTAACGGKVVVDASAEGSEGGGTATSTTTSTTTTTTDTTTTTTETCDDAGDCALCFDCAIGGPCAAAEAACDSDADCDAFATCTTGCQDIGPDACLQKCTGEHPQGSTEYLALIECAACTTCFSSCIVAFSFYCHD